MYTTVGDIAFVGADGIALERHIFAAHMNDSPIEALA